MDAKRFQVQTEEEIEQLIRDQSSKSTKKATQNAVKTLKEFCKEQNLQQSYEELNNTDLSSLLTYVSLICSIFELGSITKHLMTGLTGSSEFCFSLALNVEGLRETKLTVSVGASHLVNEKGTSCLSEYCCHENIKFREQRLFKVNCCQIQFL